VSANSLLLGVTTDRQRGRSVGVFSGGFLLGGIAGPGVGGLITEWSLRAPFFLYAATLAAAGTVGLVLLPRRVGHARPPGPDGRRAAMTLPEAFRLPAFRAAAVANLADNWAALGVRAAIIPLLVVEVLHRSPVWTGISLTVFTAANIVTLVIGGQLADRIGRRPILLVGCLTSAGGTALLTLPPSLVVLIVAMVVFGLGSGLLDVAPGAAAPSSPATRWPVTSAAWPGRSSPVRWPIRPASGPRSVSRPACCWSRPRSRSGHPRRSDGPDAVRRTAPSPARKLVT
jgi:MFS transporter, DHA1 family, multidrug resistance protein